MRTIQKPNTFARFNISAPMRTAEQQITDLQMMYDFKNPVVHTAVCIALNQRVQVSNPSDKPYWTEVFNAIKSLA